MRVDEYTALIGDMAAMDPNTVAVDETTVLSSYSGQAAVHTSRSPLKAPLDGSTTSSVPHTSNSHLWFFKKPSVTLRPRVFQEMMGATTSEISESEGQN